MQLADLPRHPFIFLVKLLSIEPPIDVSLNIALDFSAIAKSIDHCKYVSAIQSCLTIAWSQVTISINAKGMA